MDERFAFVSPAFHGRALLLCCFLFTGLATTTAASAQQDTEFEASVRAVSGKYAAELEGAGATALAGDVAAGNKRLVDLADADASPAVAFCVANLLYRMDCKASYDLHKRAYDAMPGERTTNLEWAMERHRRGEHAEAVPLYRKYLQLVPDDGRVSALLADCLVRTGNLAEAVAAWEAAGHGHHHTAIDFAICEIHGGPSPLRRRGDLLERFKKGETQLAEKLIDQDLHMDQDWWNSRASEQGLEHDLPLVEKALGAGGERFKQIRCWVDLASKEEPQAEAVAAALKAAGLLAEGGALPQSSIVASRLSAIAIDSGAETKDALLARFAEELLKRAKSAPGDVEALNMLCYLCAQGKTRERLAEYDRYGWDRYGDVRFAGSLLAGLLAQGKLAGDSPELPKALKQFPEDSTINKIAIRCAGEQGLTAAMLAAAIQSEYRHLSPGMGGYPDSYTLKGYFALLKRKL